MTDKPADPDEMMAMLEFYRQDRRWVALEIHDGFVQETTAALMFLEAASNDLKAGRSENLAAELDQSIDLLRKAILDARALINGLRPPELVELGLLASLENLCRELDRAAGAACSFRHGDLSNLPQDLDLAIYRISQEGLANANKHSKATRIELSLISDGQHLILSVDDNGQGQQGPDLPPLAGVGLQGVRERVEALGGRVDFGESRLGGAQLKVMIPQRAK